MKHCAEYIIIGGGIIGSSVAYYLSRSGKKVIVLEKEDTACGTAGATGGIISWFTCKPGAQMDFYTASDSLYRTLEQELGCDTGVRIDAGNLQVIADSYELAAAKKMLKEQLHYGFKAHIINRKEAKKMEPALADDLSGAIYVPQMHQADPIKLSLAFRKTAAIHGALFINQAEVSGLILKDKRLIGVHSNAGDFYADTTVNCGGVWASAIAKMAGIHLPVTPRKGQFVVTEPVKKLCNSAISSCSWQINAHHPELIKDKRIRTLNLSFTMEQTDTGSLILHGTRENTGMDYYNDPYTLELIMRQACRYIPKLKEMKIIRAFTGLRPWTPDQLPIIGPVQEVPGLFFCCGHGGEGIALAPISGKVTAEHLIEGTSKSFDIRPFSHKRFGAQPK